MKRILALTAVPVLSWLLAAPLAAPLSGPLAAQAGEAAAVEKPLTCQDLFAAQGGFYGFNSVLEYACAYEAFRDSSVVLLDPEKMRRFVETFAPEKWVDSEFLKTKDLANRERIFRTFVLIKRMRDFTHERFDLVDVPVLPGHAQTPTPAAGDQQKAGGDQERPSAVKVSDVDGIRHIELANIYDDFVLGDFYRALKEAQEKSIKGVVVIVRDNPGGRTDYALAMLDMLGARGLLLRTVERNAGTPESTVREYTLQDGFGVIASKLASQPDSAKKIEAAPRVEFSKAYEEHARDDDGYTGAHPLLPVIDEHMPVVVVINGGTYSAAEILAGGVQATGRGDVVGLPSAGKGAIMARTDLPMGGAVFVTDGEFFPGGIKNKGPGILPDPEVPASGSPGALDAGDPQLERADQLIEGGRRQAGERSSKAEQRTEINTARFEAEMKKRDAADYRSLDEQRQ